MLAAKISATVLLKFFSTNFIYYCNNIFYAVLETKVGEDCPSYSNLWVMQCNVAPTSATLCPSAVNTCEILHIKFCL